MALLLLDERQRGPQARGSGGGGAADHPRACSDLNDGELQVDAATAWWRKAPDRRSRRPRADLPNWPPGIWYKLVERLATRWLWSFLQGLAKWRTIVARLLGGRCLQYGHQIQCGQGACWIFYLTTTAGRPVCRARRDLVRRGGREILHPRRKFHDANWVRNIEKIRACRFA